MLDKFEKIENSINGLLSKLFGWFWNLLKKLIHKVLPSKFFTWIEQKKSQSKTYKTEFVAKQKSRGQLAMTELKKRKDQFFDKAQALQKYPVKEKGLEKLSSLKEFLFETHPKVHWFTFKQYMKPKMELFKTQATSFNNIYTKVFLGSLGILIFSGSLAYLMGHRIYREEFPLRAPANVQEYDYRPDYRLYEKKTVKVLNVKVPIWSEGVADIGTITIDFSVRTSTRFARYYITEYEYKLRDYFFTAVEPVVSDFPIEGEGKELLKAKIQEELNNFLIENNVEGEVEEVHILYIVGS